MWPKYNNLIINKSSFVRNNQKKKIAVHFCKNDFVFNENNY